MKLHIKDNLFDGCSLVHQHNQFPACLLSYLRNNIGGNSKTTSRYYFVMSLEEFERSLKPMFHEKEKTYFTEHFYDLTKEISIKEIWIKIVEQGYEKLVSIKRTKHLDSGEIAYQETVVPLSYAIENIPGFLELLGEPSFDIEVVRTTYQLKSNNNVVLKLDIATFEDDNSFVVFSITCSDFEGIDNGKEVEVNSYPCRSKIIELISKTKPTIYSSLIDRGHVKELNYKSMSQAEFEAGPEEAEKRKQLAESDKERMLRENEVLDEDDKYSPSYIQLRYRSILKFGLFRFEDDDDDFELPN